GSLILPALGGVLVAPKPNLCLPSVRPFGCTVFLYRVLHARGFMLVGYARVSTSHQNLDRQLSALRSAGCKKVFKVKESGREGVQRKELERAINELGEGDVLVLAEWN